MATRLRSLAGRADRAVIASRDRVGIADDGRREQPGAPRPSPQGHDPRRPADRTLCVSELVVGGLILLVAEVAWVSLALAHLGLHRLWLVLVGSTVLAAFTGAAGVLSGSSRPRVRVDPWGTGNDRIAGLRVPVAVRSGIPLRIGRQGSGRLRRACDGDLPHRQLRTARPHRGAGRVRHASHARRPLSRDLAERQRCERRGSPVLPPLAGPAGLRVRRRRRGGARGGRAAVRDARGDGGGAGPASRRPLRAVGQ